MGIEGVFLRAWRRRRGRTIEQAARELGVSPRMLAYYEAAEKPVPRTVLLAARALSADMEPLGPPVPRAREKWVRLVEDMRDYARGKPVIGEILKSRDTERLKEFLAMVRMGPDPKLALTDPALFRVVSESVTRARLAGLAEFRVVGADDAELPRFEAANAAVVEEEKQDTALRF